MLELIHVTAAYSNAVLLAMLPHVSDFAAKLDLPIQQPVTTNQVKWSRTTAQKDRIEGALILTNQDWFCIDYRGFVNGFRDPTNWFWDQELTDITKYLGSSHMTTNEAVGTARETLLKLGYATNLTHSYDVPDISGPYDTREGHVPYCRITWQWPKTDNLVDLNTIQVEINLDTKKLVGLSTVFSRTNTLPSSPLKVDIVPELESDYRKRARTYKMFINTNAPKHLPIDPLEK